MNAFIITNSNNKDDTLNKTLSEIMPYHKASNYYDAMNGILKKKPCLVFLYLDDVLEDPFGFIQELGTYLDALPAFIVLSKTKDKAYEAIKNGCIDYLLCPINELEVRKALLKFEKKQGKSNNKVLCLKSYNDYRYLDLDSILFLKADNNTTDFYLLDGKVVSAYKTLKVFEDLLPDNFFRIHKSYIVNSNHVVRINYGKKKCGIASNKQYNIPFTKTFSDNIEAIQSSLLKMAFVGEN